MTTADTEYSHTFPEGTRKFTIKLRDLGAEMKVAFVSGTSGTTYFTVSFGDKLIMDAKVGNMTIYFQSATAAQVAEIQSWK